MVLQMTAGRMSEHIHLVSLEYLYHVCKVAIWANWSSFTIKQCTHTNTKEGRTDNTSARVASSSLFFCIPVCALSYDDIMCPTCFQCGSWNCLWSTLPAQIGKVQRYARSELNESVIKYLFSVSFKMQKWQYNAVSA